MKCEYEENLKLLGQCADIYFRMLEIGFPEDLTKELYGLIIDIRNDLARLKSKEKSFIVRKTCCVVPKEEESRKRWVTIDGRHVNIGEDDDGGSGGTTSFHSKADPMVEVMGPAEKSHPEEIQAYKEELNNLGVELIRRKEETLAYSPSLVRGKPGKAYISQGSSYSAWSHEMQHVRDDFNDGWTGMRILENPEKRYQREVKAYNVEIKIAKSINRPDMVKRLKENLEKERREIYGE
jgi:hypothetical protein